MIIIKKYTNKITINIKKKLLENSKKDNLYKINIIINFSFNFFPLSSENIHYRRPINL